MFIGKTKRVVVFITFFFLHRDLYFDNAFESYSMELSNIKNEQSQ